MNVVFVRFISGLVLLGSAAYCFTRDPLTTGYIIGGAVLGALGLLAWGLGEAIGDLAD